MMRFFWKFLAKIYCELVTMGLEIPPPLMLFNKPKHQLEYKYFAEILADRNFTPAERSYIIEGTKDVESFCNGMIQFHIRFDLEPGTKVRSDASLILKVKSDNPIIEAASKTYKSDILGLCQTLPSGARIIYLVHDQLQNPIIYRTTVIHELGHYIGLEHTKYASIMHKSNFGNVLYPTYIDAQEMSKKYNCNPEDFKYFKL